MSFWSRLSAELFGVPVGRDDYEPANRKPPPNPGNPAPMFDDPHLQATYEEIYGGSGYGGSSDPAPEPAADPEKPAE